MLSCFVEGRAHQNKRGKKERLLASLSFFLSSIIDGVIGISMNRAKPIAMRAYCNLLVSVHPK